MDDFKEIIKMGFTLMMIGLIASLALALTNQWTTSKIEEQLKLSIKSSLQEVLPEADNFKEAGNSYDAFKGTTQVGKVLNVESSGYSSIIKMLVGIDSNDNIVGIKVLSQAETPGLGTNVEKPEWLSQFIGKKISDVKLKKDGGDIDAITGATISSRAVVKGLQNALSSVANTAPNNPKTNQNTEEDTVSDDDGIETETDINATNESEIDNQNKLSEKSDYEDDQSELEESEEEDE